MQYKVIALFSVLGTSVDGVFILVHEASGLQVMQCFLIEPRQKTGLRDFRPGLT